MLFRSRCCFWFPGDWIGTPQPNHRNHWLIAFIFYSLAHVGRGLEALKSVYGVANHVFSPWQELQPLWSKGHFSVKGLKFCSPRRMQVYIYIHIIIILLNMKPTHRSIFFQDTFDHGLRPRWLKCQPWSCQNSWASARALESWGTWPSKKSSITSHKSPLGKHFVVYWFLMVFLQ